MITFYLLFIVVIPLLILKNSKIISEKKEMVTKNDSSVIRGVAAIFVIAAHYTEYIHATGAVEINSLFYMITSQLGGMGVLMFFFISGYGNYESYGNSTPGFFYVVRRIKKVYIPYLIIKCILLFLDVLLHGWEYINWQKVLHIICVEEWFVQIILLEYCIFYIGWQWLPRRFFFLYQIIINAVLSICFIEAGLNARYYNSMWLFVIGMLCSLCKEKLNYYLRAIDKKCMGGTVVLTLGLLISGIIFVVYKDTIWSAFFKVIAGSMLCLLVIVILQKISVQSGVILWMGQCSLHLYIIHITVYNWMDFHSVIINLWGAIIITLVLTFITKKVTDCVGAVLT